MSSVLRRTIYRAARLPTAGEMHVSDTGARSGWSPGRWTLLVVPALLLLVAAFQVGRVLTLDQSTWIGGGFGMFASYDYDDTRRVVAWWDTADGPVRASLVDVSDTDLLRARVTPTSSNIRTVATQVMAGGVVPGATRLIVELRGRHIDGDDMRFPVLERVELEVSG